jgi:hypothetical protein
MKASYPKYLARIGGAHLSAPTLYQIQAFVNHLKLGHWMRANGFDFEHIVSDKWQVFDAMIDRVRNEAVLYLEFGVYRGKTTRYWSERLRHPQARLHGFDSFEGLPEEWATKPKGGIFNAQGEVPQLPDPRVVFYKGWFQDVLPSYTPPPHVRLVLIMDADLYSSTAYVLRQVRPYVRPGSLLYFDEMNHVEDEPKAVAEFMRETGLRFRPICADRTLTHSCFECVGSPPVSDRVLRF